MARIHDTHLFFCECPFNLTEEKWLKEAAETVKRSVKTGTRKKGMLPPCREAAGNKFPYKQIPCLYELTAELATIVYLNQPSGKSDKK